MEYCSSSNRSETRVLLPSAARVGRRGVWRCRWRDQVRYVYTAGCRIGKTDTETEQSATRQEIIYRKRGTRTTPTVRGLIACDDIKTFLRYILPRPEYKKDAPFRARLLSRGIYTAYSHMYLGDNLTAS